MTSVIQTAGLMFQELRRERRDVFVLFVFAAVLFFVADGVLGWVIGIFSATAGAEWAAWHPGVRPRAVGGAAGLALVVVVLRPFWRAARLRLKSKSS
jgi:ABC-type antimicrobial peptide transport system permease subunit